MSVRRNDVGVGNVVNNATRNHTPRKDLSHKGPKTDFQTKLVLLKNNNNVDFLKTKPECQNKKQQEINRNHN